VYFVKTAVRYHRALPCEHDEQNRHAAHAFTLHIETLMPAPVSLVSDEQKLRLLFSVINDRINDGQARCAMCGVQGSWAFGKFAKHTVSCPFATLLEQLSIA
jgi:hypothetical protein